MNYIAQSLKGKPLSLIYILYKKIIIVIISEWYFCW